MPLIYRRRPGVIAAIVKEIKSWSDPKDDKLAIPTVPSVPALTPSPDVIGDGPPASLLPTPTHSVSPSTNPIDSTATTRSTKSNTKPSKLPLETPDSSSNSPAVPSTTTMPNHSGLEGSEGGEEEEKPEVPSTRPDGRGPPSGSNPSTPAFPVDQAGTTRTEFIESAPTNSQPQDDENREEEAEPSKKPASKANETNNPPGKVAVVETKKENQKDDGELGTVDESSGNGLSGLSGQDKNAHGYNDSENGAAISGGSASASKKSNAGPIAGGVIGGLLIIGILIALLIFVMKRRKRRHESIYHSKEEIEPFTDTPDTGMTPTTYTAIPPPLPAQNNLQSREIQEPVVGLARSNTRNTAVSLPDRDEEQVYTNGNRPPSPTLSITMPQSAAGSQNHSFVPPSPSTGSNPQSSIPRLPLYERAPRDSDAL